jgi:hypothetical protein
MTVRTIDGGFEIVVSIRVECDGFAMTRYDWGPLVEDVASLTEAIAGQLVVRDTEEDNLSTVIRLVPRRENPG